MNEEPSRNTASTRSDSSDQVEWIAQYCGDIEARIRSAGSREKAAAIVAETCKSFESACMSGMIRTFMQRYVTELLDKYWRPQT